MFSIHLELQTLAAKLYEQQIPYALCGALALAVHGYPRATLDIDLLALSGSGERILRCGRTCGFILEAALMEFAGGTVRIERLSKVLAEIDDVLMLAMLSVSPEIEAQMSIEILEWQGVPLRTVNWASLMRLKMLRGSPQDLADVEKLK